MTRPLAVAFAFVLVLAGCLSAGPAQDPSPVEAADFDEPGAAWTLQVAGGCGMCGPITGFRDDYVSHYVFYVFDDGRLMLIEHNGGPWGPNATHVEPSITFEVQALRALMRESPRAHEGEHWIVRVTTASARQGETLDERLADLWRPDAEDDPCTDEGISYALRLPNGSIERQDFTCGPSGPPDMMALAQELHRLREATKEHGHVEGMTSAQPNGSEA